MITQLKVEYVGEERRKESQQPVYIGGHLFGPSGGWVVVVDANDWEAMKKESPDLRLVERDGTEPAPLEEK